MIGTVITAYRCNPEYCDDGFHTEKPVAEPGYRIRSLSSLDEFQSDDGSEAFVPATSSLVQEWTGWRMECGGWWFEEPKPEDVERCETCGYMRAVSDKDDKYLGLYGDCGCGSDDNSSPER